MSGQNTTLTVAQEPAQTMPSDHLPTPSGQPGAARIPQELIDKVIGELHNDKAALKQCSLVAKNWEPASSPLLLRRVLWPPCAKKGDVCEDPLAGAPSLPCKYAPRSQNSFALCLEILSSSPRLQRFVRELVCMPPSHKHGLKDDVHGVLDLGTFIEIVKHMPHLEAVHLQLVALRADGSRSLAGTGRTLKKLSASSSSMDWLWNLFPFLSTFGHVHHLVLTVHGFFPQGWSTDAPSSKLAVDILECNHYMDQPIATSSLSFYAGLVHNLDLRTLRRFTSDAVQPGFTDVVSAAPALESLGLHFSAHRLPLDLDRIPPRLTNVDTSCMFGIHFGDVVSPGADDTWIRIWKTLRAAAQFPIRHILVNTHFIFFQPLGCSDEDLSVRHEAVLSQITQWQIAVNVLDGFGCLESITFVLRLSIWQPDSHLKFLSVHEHQLAAMRDIMKKGLPRRYATMLDVKAAVIESGV